MTIGYNAGMRFRPRFSLRTLLLVMAIIGSVAAIIVSRPSSVPLRGSKSEIRVWLLKKTPLGITTADLHRIAADEGLGDPLAYFKPDSPGIDKYGCTLGTYRDAQWTVRVEAYWHFDDNGKLKDIEIDKLNVLK